MPMEIAINKNSSERVELFERISKKQKKFKFMTFKTKFLRELKNLKINIKLKPTSNAVANKTAAAMLTKRPNSVWWCKS